MSSKAKLGKLKKNARSKHKSIRPVHQRVKLFRAQEPFLSVFMWGINYSVNELRHVTAPAVVMTENFKAFTKVKIDNHLFNKDNMPSHFKVKEYCPIVFRELRQRFGVDDTDFCHSLTADSPRDVDSPGRSGARFLQSTDGLYIIKSMEKEDVAQMHTLLDPYYQYVVERHGRTLLPHFLGMYRLTVDDREHYLIVMRNVFSPKRFPIHHKYDLKGSTVDRQASEKELAKDLPTLKDNDFVRSEKQIHIGEERKRDLLEQLRKDVMFLSGLNVMDYSLLVGIHDIRRAEEEASGGSDEDEEQEEEDYDSAGSDTAGAQGPESPQAGDGQDTLGLALGGMSVRPCDEVFAVPSEAGHQPEEIYFLGLIDTLTNYGVKKRTASLVKSAKHGADAEFSTVKPEAYAQRFLDFIEKCLH